MRTRMAPLVGWWVLGLVFAILVGGPPSGAAGWWFDPGSVGTPKNFVVPTRLVARGSGEISAH
jgi:hypothetical protein